MKIKDFVELCNIKLHALEGMIEVEKLQDDTEIRTNIYEEYVYIIDAVDRYLAAGLKRKKS